MAQNDISPKTIYDLGALAEYSEESISKIRIAQKAGGDIILMAFNPGQALKEHTAPVDALVQVLEGKCHITIAGEHFDLTVGQFIRMPANIPHSVTANGPFKMLLTKIKD